MVDKWVIFYENQYTVLGREYFRLEETTAVGLHNPSLATHFDTEKEALEATDKFYLEVKATPLSIEVELFNQTDWKYRTVTLLNPELNIPYADEMTNAEVLEWHKKIRRLPDMSVKSEVYSSYPPLYALFHHIWDALSYHSKDYTEKYYSFNIKANRDSEFNVFKSDLALILDDVTLMSDDGYKTLPIFDHELSEFESRFLLYKSDDDCKIMSSRYPLLTGTLEECFNEIKYKYYYE